jgi:hypothetical protein
MALASPRRRRPDDGDDPWGGGSADCYYEGLEEWDSTRQRREHEAKRTAKGLGPALQPGDLQPGQSIDTTGGITFATLSMQVQPASSPSTPSRSATASTLPISRTL